MIVEASLSFKYEVTLGRPEDIRKPLRDLTDLGHL